MISINLSTQKKAVDITNVGGLDLSKIKVKFVLIAILISYLPDFIILPSLEEERAAAQETINNLTTEANKKRKQVNSLKGFDKQIQQLKRREQQLVEKLELVKTIISKKKNPWKVLEYVAKNIPPEIWLTEIYYEDDKMIFKGLSMDYTNQGVFLENLKRSVFFADNIAYSKVDTAAMSSDMKKMAPFEITANIVRYE
ncbi:MAG: PilN domain-containing protein [Proteobacteria bacterium]|jgi:Tfp pilus assembly protein PilN|nr:PilN domain-containing protein [Pseudomonadota bacterium]